MVRREFLNKAVSGLLLWTGVGFLLNACAEKGAKSSSSPSTTSGNCLANGASSSIAYNHGHTAFVVPAADVNVGIQQTYTLGVGTALHSHTVTVTAAHFTSLK